MQLDVYTDGGAINNPGPAASAFVVVQGKKIIAQEKKAIGNNTNNMAEYTAVIIALEKLPQLINEQIKRIVFYSDSKLMVNQINGLYKVKAGHIREQIMRIRVLEAKINLPIVYKNIPREENEKADSLVKEALQ
jgi:ribonuclease HI